VPPLPDRSRLHAQVQETRGVPAATAAAIVEAFDAHIASPLQANLSSKKGRDLAKRNPMIYTIRGTTTVAEWVRRTLDDWETSAIEGHIGTWMEEVARIVSGGVKPGSGVDLQVERTGDPPVVELYAIQAAPNAKNAGGTRSDRDSLRAAAAALRASRRHVETYVAVLHGLSRSGVVRGHPDITKLGSDDFWEKISGIPDFRARLLKASTFLASLVTGRVAAEVDRIAAEAAAIYGDADGNFRLDVLANPPSARAVRNTLRPPAAGDNGPA
jgi:Type II restriction endonuclease EcoO109I